MAYAFPDEGLEGVDTQFMLGDDLLAAPVLEQGAKEKTVFLPRGRWQDWKGQVWEGGRVITLPVTLADIPHFTRV